MSRRQKAKTEDNIEPEGGHVEEEVPESPPGTRRTRSGRKVRTPAALLEAEAPVRTPTRRTRRTVLQELPALEDKNTEEEPRIAESLAEEKLSLSADPKPEEPGTQTDTADVNGSGDIHPSAPGDTAAPDPAPAPDPETVPKKKTRLDPSEKTIPMIPLGKPKSGRVWKNRNKQRFSALVRDKPLCSSWEKKMEAKREKQLVKQYSLQLKEEKARQKEEKRKRREENLKRRAENERKAEIVQVIKSTAKIKRMKKKQLRKIEKRDTLALLQKTQTQKQNVKAKGQKNSKVDQDLT